MDFNCAQLKLHNVFGIPAFHQLRSKPQRYNADIMGRACIVNAGMFDNTMCAGGSNVNADGLLRPYMWP